MSSFYAVLVDGVMYAAWLFLVALGLTLVYGVLKILNMAHGSFYAIGAYAGVTLIGPWVAHGGNLWLSYLLLVVAAILAGGVVGVAVERGVLKRFYNQDPVVLLLVTYALFLIIEDAIKLVWGVDPYSVSEPYSFLGNFELGDLSYPRYNFIIVGAAIVAGTGLMLFLRYARAGRLLRAVIHDREVSQALGIQVNRYFVWTFSAGAVLAALGGALTAPTISVAPGMSVEIVVLTFAVVVIGGLGSLPGAALGALLVGLVRALAVHYWPQSELFSIYIVMALVLAVRPKGLFAPLEARKI
ncbi:branched-chain amino acid ABC transporter permease [Paraburkholderia sp. GAS42]|uniref:branched-chain amino acid ABC transporter permease n=1 Tax=Paraburkholderia sp. GAS42 TaxID=3035135 RepID=UPI003D1D7399